VDLGGAPRSGTVIPRSAVVHAAGRAWAYLQAGDLQFVRREIPLDHPAERGWFTTAHFHAGDRVVVAGGQILLSEESKSQIQVGEEGTGP
jgi:hypothetical protein